MTLIINNTDLSDYVMQETDIVETPNYVNGPNIGTSKVGTPIFDRIHTRYTASFPMKPLPQALYAQVISLCELNSATVVYTSARAAADIGVTAQCSISAYKYALDVAGTRIYYGATITVEGA